MKTDRFDQIHVGDEQEIVHTISLEDVKIFINLTGDHNPLHMDEDYAAKTTFKKPVVHGMLTASFLSTMIGMKLPGPGSLWYELNCRFLAPARVGEQIRVWAKVKQKSVALRTLVLDAVIFGEANRRLIESEVKVKLLGSETKTSKNTASDQGQVNAVTTSTKDGSSGKNRKGAVIITGASRGIGKAIAVDLSRQGYPVVINYSKSQAQALQVVEEIKLAKGRAIAVQADVRDEVAVQNMVQQALAEFGAIYGIVNNASASLENLEFDQVSWASFQEHIDVGLKGAFHLARAVLPHLCARQSGVIVNVASIYADNVPPIKLMPYHTAKSALIAFSKSLAVEYGPKGIRVNCVSPGMTDTDLIANVPEKIKIMTKMQTPLRRLAVPEDIAGPVVFLFSDQAAFITGQNLRICGGMIMA